MSEIGKRDILSQEVFDDIKEFTKDIEGATIAVKGLADAGKAIGVNLKAAESTKAVREETEKLTLSQVELQKIEKQIETANARNTEAYRAKQKALNDVKQATKDATTLGEKNAQAITAQNASLKELQAALAKNRAAYASLASEEARASKEGVALKNVIEQQDKSVKEINGSLGNFKDNVGDYEGSFKRAGASFQQIAPSAAGAAQGIYGMVKASLAFIATPIGIVIAALGAAIFALTSYFKGSEEGQNRLNKITAVGAAIFEQFMNVVEALGEALFDAFTNPQQAMKDVGNFLKDQIVNRFMGLLELIPQLGKAIGLLFKGQFAEAGKVAVDAAAKVGLGVENATDKIKGLIAETKKLVDAGIDYGNKIAKLEAEIDKQERKLIVERAETNLKVAKLREEAITLEGKAKREALEEAIRLETELSDNEVRFARLRLRLAQTKRDANGDDKAALKEVAEAQAAVTDAEKMRFDNTVKFRKQLKALDDEDVKAEQAKTKAIQDRMNAAGKEIDKTIHKNVELSDSAKDTAKKITAYFGPAFEKVSETASFQLSKLRDKWVNTIEQIQDTFNMFAGNLNQIFQNISEKRMQELDAESAANEEKLNKDLLLAGDNEEAKEQLKLNAEKKELEIEKRRRAEARKSAIINKAFALAEAIIATALGVAKASPVIPLMLLAGAAGAVQIAAIASQPIPSYFKGTDFHPGGPAEVGERGIELMRSPTGQLSLTPSVSTVMDIPRGTQVIPHDKTMQMLAMGALQSNGGSLPQSNHDPELLHELKQVNANLSNIKPAKAPSLVRSGSVVYEAMEDARGNVKLRRSINLGKYWS